MSDEFTVDTQVLFGAAPRWIDQAARLATARARIVDSSAVGFPGAVAARVGTWASAWGTVVGDLADRAQEVADQLDAAYVGYTESDTEAREQFQTWLRDAE